MKKFLLKTLLLLLPIAVLAAFMEYFLQQIPNDYIYKKSYLEKHSKKLQILIFGNSHAYFGINPAYLPQKAFNASHISQTLNFDFEIFSKYQKDLSNLKVIVLPISYFSLWEKLEYEEPFRVKNYVLYYGLRAKSIFDYSELLNDKLAQNIKRLINYYAKHKNNITSDNLGWGTNYSFAQAENWSETGKAAALKHTHAIHSKKAKKIFAENMEILNSFAEFCNKNNVKLILITMPAHNSYRENLNTEQLSKMKESLNNFAAKHSGVQYMNWLEDSNFTAENFYDADHFNETGAEKFSLELARYLLY
jgi:hypothetical protein